MENAPFQVLMMDLAYTEIVIQRDSPWAPKYAIVKVCVTYTPDGLHVLTGYYDGMVRVWGGLEDSAPPRRFKAHSSYLTNILFFRNNTRLVTNAHTDNARAWDLTDDLSITGSSEM